MRKKALFSSLALLLLGMFCIILSGCGSEIHGIPTSQILNYSIIGAQDISTLDPALPKNLATSQAIELVYSGLVSLDPKTLRVVPDIATGWDVSNGGKTYAFHLRSGVAFSNGDPVDASTFAYSIDRALDPALASSAALLDLGRIVGASARHAGKLLSMIGTGVVVVNPLTLEINLDAPIGFFLQALAASPSWAVDEKALQQSGGTLVAGQVIGTGPFQLTSWEQGAKMVFKPNPHWYGKTPILYEIFMSLYADTHTAFNDYESKEIDVDTSVGSADYPAAQALPGPRQFFKGPSLTMRYLAPNSAMAPFDNLLVRQAFAEAVDRATLANQVLQGFVTPSDHMVPQGMPGYFAGLKGLPFNPQDARAKLNSVYPDRSQMPTVTLEYARAADNDAVAAKLQKDFQTYLGVQIALHPVDDDQLMSDVSTGQVQLSMLSWTADYPDPQDWLSLQVARDARNNSMKFEDTRVDQLTAQADGMQNQAQRLKLYNQAEELAIDEVAWIPFAQGENGYAVQHYVSGYSQDVEGLTPDNVWPNVRILS